MGSEMEASVFDQMEAMKKDFAKKGLSYRLSYSNGAITATTLPPRRPKAPRLADRPYCGARLRSGRSCRARVRVRPDGELSERCRLHGGLSTGPRTEIGRAAISASNTRRQGTRYKPRENLVKSKETFAEIRQRQFAVAVLTEDGDEMAKLVEEELARRQAAQA